MAVNYVWSPLCEEWAVALTKMIQIVALLYGDAAPAPAVAGDQAGVDHSPPLFDTVALVCISQW